MVGHHKTIPYRYVYLYLYDYETEMDIKLQMIPYYMYKDVITPNSIGQSV